MNWLSTMKMRSNFAASASCARAMYQRISTLALPGISGLSQVLCCPGPPTPIRMAPSLRVRRDMMQPSFEPRGEASWRVLVAGDDAVQAYASCRQRRRCSSSGAHAAHHGYLTVEVAGGGAGRVTRARDASVSARSAGAGE